MYLHRTIIPALRAQRDANFVLAENLAKHLLVLNRINVTAAVANMPLSLVYGVEKVESSSECTKLQNTEDLILLKLNTSANAKTGKKA